MGSAVNLNIFNIEECCCCKQKCSVRRDTEADLIKQKLIQNQIDELNRRYDD